MHVLWFRETFIIVSGSCKAMKNRMMLQKEKHLDKPWIKTFAETDSAENTSYSVILNITESIPGTRSSCYSRGLIDIDRVSAIPRISRIRLKRNYSEFREQLLIPKFSGIPYDFWISGTASNSGIPYRITSRPHPHAWVHGEFDFAADSNLEKCFLKLNKDVKSISSIGV